MLFSFFSAFGACLIHSCLTNGATFIEMYLSMQIEAKDKLAEDEAESQGSCLGVISLNFKLFWTTFPCMAETLTPTIHHVCTPFCGSQVRKQKTFQRWLFLHWDLDTPSEKGLGKSSDCQSFLSDFLPSHGVSLLSHFTCF